ncbi:ADP,ATP carrier protein [Microthyrium microscopicum]|uniref:Mitochondrial thiamine pyrophosphate carrier 1 n=1 Tax=Microthyrium microscopicum TaxID=703497 RepID=A0A6A6U9G1_9PEZI|nr:ADP,ATP carrier protein [Microthyrium microscopicum]
MTLDKPRQTLKSIHTAYPFPRRKLDKQSGEYIIKSGIAGGIAGCAAKTIVAPLDRVKILFQTSNPQYSKYSGSWGGFVTALRGIYSQDGSRGLFRGHSATLLRIFPYAGIKFLAYEQIRHVVIPSKEYETHLRRFASGSLAGMVSVLFTYPLEVIRVRAAFETKVDKRNTLSGICKKIYAESPRIPHPTNPNEMIALKSVPLAGLANFFRGFSATMVGMIPYAGASFLAHDTVSELLRTPAFAAKTTIPGSGGGTTNPDKPPQLKYWAELLSGGFAGFFSQTVSYPVEVIRRRMQVGGVVGDGRRLRMVEVASQILAEKGFKGFFVGLGIGYLKIVPMAATSFFAYERAKWYLGI